MISLDFSISEIVNLGVSICMNIFFIKYFFADHKKLTENIEKLVIELKEMKSCINNINDDVKELKRVS